MDRKRDGWKRKINIGRRTTDSQAGLHRITGRMSAASGST